MREQIGVAQKIGYSFLGLLVGNLVSLATLVLMAILQQSETFSRLRQIWALDCGQALLLSLVILVCSMLAWVVAGLPFILLLPEKVASGSHWAVALLIGALLGAISMLFFVFVFDHGQVKLAMLFTLVYQILLSLAALIAGVAFLVYCALLRQTRKSGAPFGTPHSMAWFDF